MFGHRFFVIGLLLTFATGFALCPQNKQSQGRPQFSNYPVTEVFRGKPAKPILDAQQRVFRTMIRKGSEHPVEFAGHYTVPRWGCGAFCDAFAIVDSISGHVYDGFVVTEFPGSLEEGHVGDLPSRMEFHPDSRLMKINGCPNERDCGFYDYVLVEGQGLKLLRKQLLPKEFQ